MCVLCYSHVLMCSNSTVLTGMFGVCQGYELISCIMFRLPVDEEKRSQFDKLNKMHLLRNRHICTGRPHLESITNVHMVERVRKWENVQSYKKIIKQWICRDYTMKIRTKINSEFAKFAPDYKRGHTAHCWAGQLLTTQGNQQYFWYTILTDAILYMYHATMYNTIL